MKIEFNNKKVLVLAASQGLGKEIAHTFSKNGADVVICSRNFKKLSATALEIGATPIQVDLSNPNEIEDLIYKTKEILGRIDILVTNTGGPSQTTFMNTDIVSWEDNFNSLFLSASLATKYVMKEMLNNGWGRVIFLASIAAKEPVNGLIFSNSLRAGLVSLAKTISDEVAETGITVNCVLPGYIRTSRLEELGIDLEEFSKSIPMKRLGTPSELANAVAFLASDLASYITGQTLSVDGGMTKTAF